MMSNNKILTVSYGTFSCTLEGFDDSFDTMKAIAEYFRDLASDDRYFGAEPPQPDAEMLARIAEREIERRVEARMNDGRIFLSAMAPDAAPSAVRQTAPKEKPAEPAPTAPVAETAPTPEAPVAVAPVAEAEPTPEMIPEADAVQLQDSDAVADDVIAEDSVAEDAAEAVEEIEAASDDTIETPAEIEETAAEIEEVEPEAAEAFQEDVTEAEAFFADTDTAPSDIVEGEPEDQQDEVAEAEDVITPVRPRTVPHADSIAAKLERIRAVVSQANDDDSDDDYDDEADIVTSAAHDDALAHAVMDDQDDAAQDAAADVIAEAAADVTAALAEDEDDDASSVEDDSMVMSAEDEDEDLEAMLARLDDSMSQVDAVALAETVEAPEVAEVTADQPEDSAEINDDANMFGEDQDDADEAYEDEASDDDDEEIMIIDDEDENDEDQNDTVETAVAAAPRIARIIKIKRADLEAAIAQGNLEEMADDEDNGDEDSTDKVNGDEYESDLKDVADVAEHDESKATTRHPHSTLSDEDEEALLRELESVEAELTGVETVPAETLGDEDEDDLQGELADTGAELSGTEPTEPTAAEEGDQDQDEDQDEIEVAEDADQPAEATRQAPAKLDAADEDDMDRLMAKADVQMGEPESARNRDAFAHLRAAVAAKNSDENIVGAKIAEEALEVRAYQTDLADVVKPRRPEMRGAGTDRRPDVTRPAPLKLVAEQRVDTMLPSSDGPVRPRRVAAAPAIVETSGAHSFAEFADDMGAHDLPDLLEAAAAFLTFVEDRDQFSRPQVMSKVRQVIGADFSREDGLRSFGQLLRAGKIEKIEGGRFAVSGDIGFRPDQRAAG